MRTRWLKPLSVDVVLDVDDADADECGGTAVDGSIEVCECELQPREREEDLVRWYIREGLLGWLVPGTGGTTDRRRADTGERSWPCITT